MRWTPAAGSLSHVFDDELVCASLGVDAARLRAVEPFPTDTLVPYDAGYLSGWTVERYQIDLVAAADAIAIGDGCQAQANCARPRCRATPIAIWTCTPGIEDQTFKHILAPIWLLTYTYGRRTFQVVVNGVTGTMAGSRPWSWIKITLAVIAVILVILMLSMLSES